MSIRPEERKRLIGDLLEVANKNNELGIIDVLRKISIKREYADLFRAEDDEAIKMKSDNKNVRRFTLRHLQSDYTKKLNIRSGHTELKELLVFIFKDKLLKDDFTTKDDGYIQKRRKIDQWKIKYTFFIGLLKNEVCKLNRYKNALRVLGINDLKQSDLDNDVYFNEHDNIARMILNKHLFPFLKEYQDYLG